MKLVKIIFGIDNNIMSNDEVIGMKKIYIHTIVGIMEILISLYIIKGRKEIVKACLILWLSSNFILYRITRWLIGAKESCGCLGVESYEKINNVYLEYVIMAIIIYLFVGSVIKIKNI